MVKVKAIVDGVLAELEISPEDFKANGEAQRDETGAVCFWYEGQPILHLGPIKAEIDNSVDPPKYNINQSYSKLCERKKPE